MGGLAAWILSLVHALLGLPACLAADVYIHPGEVLSLTPIHVMPEYLEEGVAPLHYLFKDVAKTGERQAGD